MRRDHDSDSNSDTDSPHVVASERDTALAFLGYLRAGLTGKLRGLDEVQARLVLVPSGTTILGLVKHAAAAEQYWVHRRFAGDETVEALSGAGFTLGSEDTVASVLSGYEAVARRTDEIVTACTDIETPMARGRSGLTLRWVLAHLCEETGRHAGHAGHPARADRRLDRPLSNPSLSVAVPDPRYRASDQQALRSPAALRRLSGRRLRSQCDGQRAFVGTSPDGEPDLLPRLGGPHVGGHVLGARDRLAVVGHDHVSGLEAPVVGR